VKFPAGFAKICRLDAKDPELPIDSLRERNERSRESLDALQVALTRPTMMRCAFSPAGNPRGNERPSRFLRERTMWRHLEAALRSCGLPRITWYEATKHTMASHWLMRERSIAKLATILGHSDAEVSRRYGHIRPDLYSAEDRAALPGAVPHEDFQAGLPAPVAGTNGEQLGNIRTNSEGTRPRNSR
jgi:hypothetical protein